MFHFGAIGPAAIRIPARRVSDSRLRKNLRRAARFLCGEGRSGGQDKKRKTIGDGGCGPDA